LDKEISLGLQNDPKERAENIMITDLVRNDLARTAEKGSVRVEELCGLYSFRTVHQLITTISSQIRKGTRLNEILKTTFPMGSMTGAPKLRAMNIIEEFEHNKRGIYSGSIGYISPHGDLDLNVVIRSILYNKKNQQLSLAVGSAITYQSEPQKEYEECLLKAEALLKALE
jgi:para-aminobenzoate synthetase component 1